MTQNSENLQFDSLTKHTSFSGDSNISSFLSNYCETMVSLTHPNAKYIIHFQLSQQTWIHAQLDQTPREHKLLCISQQLTDEVK